MRMRFARVLRVLTFICTFPNHMSRLETPRLILRNFSAADLERVVELTSNPDFMRFSGGSLFNREQAEGFLERLLAPARLGKPAQFAVISAPARS